MRLVKTLLRDIERNRRLHEDADFMAEAVAATRLQARWSANALMYSITALFAVFMLWACFAEVEQLTRGSGQVVPTTETQLVQSLEGGILDALMVEEGASVKKGQVLARIKNVAFASDQKGIEAKAAALTIKRARLKAEASGEPFTPPADTAAQFPAIASNEQALYASRQQDLKNTMSMLDDNIRRSEADLREISAQVSRLSETRGLLEKEVAMTRAMVAKNAAPKMEGIKLERELADLRGNLSAATQKRSSIEAQLSATRGERAEKENKFKSEALGEITGVEAELAGLSEMLNTANDRVDRSELRAPADGIIKSIHMRTIGGVIEPAKVFMEIVPVHDVLKISAKVSPADIAFLKIGQPVRVGISAYDPQRYGKLDGKLTRIGADTVTDQKGNIFFEIDVVTDKTYLGTKASPLPINVGMVAQVDVVTGKRSIMSYLLKPFLRARQEALTER
ncbi:MAG: HlyD family type I secretion periplasmic adaptor subunit [Alphaproteobacteria bacterium]|nr:HlyD family type I secretion periplasmic adaptor subunit [Alphaproteobacteria bacterium]